MRVWLLKDIFIVAILQCDYCAVYILTEYLKCGDVWASNLSTLAFQSPHVLHFPPFLHQPPNLHQPP